KKEVFALFVLSVVKYVLQDDRKGRREHREKRGLCALCALCGQISIFQSFKEGSMQNIMALCDEVRDIAYAIHVYHGHGHLEKVYENALAHRVRKAGHKVAQQHPIKVYDEDGTLIGDYFADLLIDDILIIELKTAKAIAPEHEAQILGYLKSSRMEHGMLINFGSYRFQIRKYIWNA
ncbi:MAG: GxxExxY protein, partial [Anaerolineae bacterium]